MGTRETRAERGRRRGLQVVSKLVGELAAGRQMASVSQQKLADLLGWTQSAVSRFERRSRPESTTFIEVAQVAAALGLELGAGLYPVGDPIRDSGHQALIRRFRAMLSSAWQVVAELPLPDPGGLRAWDLVLRVAGCIVGVEAETRLRDVQAFTRRIRQREVGGGTNFIVVVLAESALNRSVLPQLLESLGSDYATPPRAILAALRSGQPLPGSGVVLL